MLAFLWARFPMCMDMLIKWFCMHKILCMKKNLWRPDKYRQYMHVPWLSARYTENSSRLLSLSLLLLQNSFLIDQWNHLDKGSGVYSFKLISDYHFWIILRNYDDVVGTGITKDGSAFNLPLILEHLLWTQWLWLWQKIELPPTPLWQILHGHFKGSAGFNKFNICMHWFLCT